MGLAARPGRARPDRPQRPRDPVRHRTPNAAPDRNRRLGIGVGDGGFPAGGAGCAVSLCRRRVDVLTEPTGGPFSRGRRGPFFSCHFQSRRWRSSISPSSRASSASRSRACTSWDSSAAPRTSSLLGPPGVGKTHLAISLAITAAEAGRRVYYGTLTGLIDTLMEARAAGELSRRLRVLTHPALLVVDESVRLSSPASRATYRIRPRSDR